MSRDGKCERTNSWDSFLSGYSTVYSSLMNGLGLNDWGVKAQPATISKYGYS